MLKILSSEHDTTLHDFNENRLFLGKLKILEGGLYEDGCGYAIFSIPFKYELLESITSFITSVQDYVGCTAAKVYLDEEQSDSAQCLLYKYYDGVSTIATIISKDDSLRGIVLSTKSGEIVRVSGNAVGLTENGLVKIKRTDNDRYAFAR